MACCSVRESVIAPQEAYNQGLSAAYPPLIGACVQLITSIACDVRLRGKIRQTGVAQTLAAIALGTGGQAASVRQNAAVAVGILVGPAWPEWAIDVIRTGVIQLLMVSGASKNNHASNECAFVLSLNIALRS
jgi:hypothetical protein